MDDPPSAGVASALGLQPRCDQPNRPEDVRRGAGYRAVMVVGEASAMAWRLRRQALEPEAASSATEASATDLIGRVLALRGWPPDAADLAVCVRQVVPDRGGLERALDTGEAIRSYAFRGGSYAFTHDVAALVLSARTVTRIWETRRWQEQGGFALDDWEPFREELCTALADGPKTREEISARLAETELANLADAATGTGADSLYKPLHWWGDICFGPQRDGRQTFRLLRGDPRWPGLAPADEAGRELLIRYLGAYGPASVQNLGYWLTEGLGVPRRRLQQWLTDLGDELVTVDVDGAERLLLRRDVDELRATDASAVVRLLPAFDPWILGPGTADTQLLAPARRSLFSRGANPLVWRGIVAGSWRLRGTTVEVSWFSEVGPPDHQALADDVQRMSTIRGRELRVTSSSI